VPQRKRAVSYVRISGMKRKVRGFTIIELLVVLAVIAVLSSIAIVRFSSVQASGRDSKRLSDVSQIQKALGLYQIDNRFFPVQTSPIEITGEDSFSLVLESAGVIPEVPTDPLSGYTYTYQSNSAGTDYDIGFCLETDGIPNYSQGCGNTISP